MAKFVFDDASLTVGGTDLSDHIETITLAYDGESVECTSMGDSGRTYLSGLTTFTVDVTFRQDFDASKVDVTLFSLVGGSSAALVMRPIGTDVVSSTNPQFSGSAILTTYSGPLAGTVGDIANATAAFQGTGALTRATST
jgi:hypothetical protein